MSEDPGAIIVRDRRTGQPISISTSIFPGWMKPSLWWNNPCWQYNGFLTKDQVLAFIDPKIPELPRALIKRIKEYMLNYAKHIICSVWLFMPASEREGYESAMLPVIQKAELYMLGKDTKEEAKKLMWYLLDNALDPF